MPPSGRSVRTPWTQSAWVLRSCCRVASGSARRTRLAARGFIVQHADLAQYWRNSAMPFIPGNLRLPLILVCLSLPVAAAAPLRSPWDLHPVALSDHAYSCPEPTHVSANLTSSGYYTDSHHSVVDPEAQQEYKEATAPYQEVVRKIVAAADTYQTTGSRAGAECAAALIDAAAKDRFLAGNMNGRQSYYVQKWLVGAVAIAYLKTRPSGVVSPAQNAEIVRWLR